jgi:hypothetical protein
MPVVMKIGRLKFIVYFKDHRPAHVHVLAPDCEAKFKISDGNCLSSTGFSKKAVLEISKLVIKHSSLLEEAWREYEGEK